MSILNTFKKGLSKTRDILFTDIDEFFSKQRKIDSNLLEELEEILVMSDIGIDISMKIMGRIEKSKKTLNRR